MPRLERREGELMTRWEVRHPEGHPNTTMVQVITADDQPDHVFLALFDTRLPEDTETMAMPLDRAEALAVMADLAEATGLPELATYLRGWTVAATGEEPT